MSNSLQISDMWDCRCGRCGITSKFCPECGAKRPEAEKQDSNLGNKKISLAKVEPWNCSCGTKWISSKYCPKCGNAKTYDHTRNPFSKNEVADYYKYLLKSYLKSAQDGNTSIFFTLGEWYEKGLGTPKNNDEALKWYTRSANVGKANADLYFKLGEWSEKGIGGAKNKEAALQWYLEAFEAGKNTEKLISKLDALCSDGVAATNSNGMLLGIYLRLAESGKCDSELFFKIGECFE